MFYFYCMLTRRLCKTSLFTCLQCKLCKLKGRTAYAITQRPSGMSMCPFYDLSTHTHTVYFLTHEKPAVPVLTGSNDRVDVRTVTHTSNWRDSTCKEKQLRSFWKTTFPQEVAAVHSSFSSLFSSSSFLRSTLECHVSTSWGNRVRDNVISWGATLPFFPSLISQQSRGAREEQTELQIELIHFLKPVTIITLPSSLDSDWTSSTASGYQTQCACVCVCVGLPRTEPPANDLICWVQ